MSSAAVNVAHAAAADPLLDAVRAEHRPRREPNRLRGGPWRRRLALSPAGVVGRNHLQLRPERVLLPDRDLVQVALDRRGGPGPRLPIESLHDLDPTPLPRQLGPVLAIAPGRGGPRGWPFRRTATPRAGPGGEQAEEEKHQATLRGPEGPGPSTLLARRRDRALGPAVRHLIVAAAPSQGARPGMKSGAGLAESVNVSGRGLHRGGADFAMTAYLAGAESQCASGLGLTGPYFAITPPLASASGTNATAPAASLAWNDRSSCIPVRR